MPSNGKSTSNQITLIKEDMGVTMGASDSV